MAFFFFILPAWLPSLKLYIQRGFVLCFLERFPKLSSNNNTVITIQFRKSRDLADTHHFSNRQVHLKEGPTSADSWLSGFCFYHCFLIPPAVIQCLRHKQ